MFRIVLVVLVLFVVSASARAEIYRYVLEDGTVMFTTEPQRGESPTEVYGEPDRDSRDRTIPTPPTAPNPNPDRSPDAFDEIIREASAAYGIPFEFIKAVIRVESAFDPHAVSHAGAQGLMQLMPGTAESLNCDDPFDPRANIMAGTQFLSINAMVDDYVYFIDQTSRLYYGTITEAAYRSSINGFFGGGSTGVVDRLHPVEAAQP